MKRPLTLLLLLFICFSCYSKSSDKFAWFYFHKVPDSVSYGVDYFWTVNSKTVSLKGDTIKIKVNYPGFDTVRLVNNYGRGARTIITRFDAGHIYELSDHSECHDAQIHDTKTYKSGQKLHWKNETGVVLFKIKNYEDSNLIAGTYGEIRQNFTRGNVLKLNKTNRIEDPILTEPSCFCFHIKIGTGSIRREIEIYEDERFTNFYFDEGRVFVLKNVFIDLEYKFFNNETLTVTYDNSTKSVKLKLN